MAAAAAAEPRHESARHSVLFERVLERVYRYFKKMVRDPAAAEECAQQALLQLEASLREGTYDPGCSFNTWLWIKAHSVFVNYCREHARRPAPLGEAEPAAPAAADPCARVDERLDAAAILERVEREVGTEAYEIFVLRYQGGLTLEEVAETVGRDRKTVAGRLRAVHAKIDRLLGKGGPE
jgi:RNA polymerase sigma-70 factor (ECF subfamily)